MTLIVGIKCEDGIVLGADGAATYATTSGIRTAMQPTRKLEIIGEDVIFGLSGPVGLGQSYIHALRQQQAAPGTAYTLRWTKIGQARDGLRDLFWQHAKPAYEMSSIVGTAYGNPQYKAQEVAHQTVVAVPFGDQVYLIQFDDKCQPEEVSFNLPTVAIGSGQPQADSLLAFMRNILWPNHTDKPTIAEGIFVALWTLKTVIAATPGGVAEPIQVIVLERHNNRWKARELPEDEFNEHLVKVAQVRDGIRQVVIKGGIEDAQIPPMPEKMTSSS